MEQPRPPTSRTRASSRSTGIPRTRSDQFISGFQWVQTEPRWNDSCVPMIAQVWEDDTFLSGIDAVIWTRILSTRFDLCRWCRDGISTFSRAHHACQVAFVTHTITVNRLGPEHYELSRTLEFTCVSYNIQALVIKRIESIWRTCSTFQNMSYIIYYLPRTHLSKLNHTISELSVITGGCGQDIDVWWDSILCRDSILCKSQRFGQLCLVCFIFRVREVNPLQIQHHRVRLPLVNRPQC